MAIEFNLNAENVKAVARANRVVIHNPPNGTPTVSFRNEKVVYQDNEPVASSKLPSTTRNVSSVATEIVTVVDPVLGTQFSISVAGMSEAIEQFFLKWFSEDNPELVE